MSPFDTTLRFPAGKPIAVISFPRSGTHLTIDGLRHFFRETYRKQRFNQPVHDLYINLDRLNLEHPYDQIPRQILEHFAAARARVIIKTHCSTSLEQVGPEYRDFARQILDESDLVYVVRDPRPVIASYMALRPLKYPDSPINLHDFLRTKIDGFGTPAENWAMHVSGWIDRPGVRIIRFEDMMKDYAGAIEKLGAALNLTRTNSPIIRYDKPESIRANKIRRYLGRQLSSSIDNLRMKFKSPDWKTAMTPEDLALIESHAGPIMRRLGYLPDVK